MIQRIQSIFMAAASLSALMLLIFPIAWYYGSSNTIAFYVFGFVEHLPDAPALKSWMFFLPLIVLTVVLIVLPLVAVFNYKRLQQQYRLMRVNMFVSILLVAALLLYYTTNAATLTSTEPSYATGVFIPLIILVFSFLAMRGIKKDVKLLRSVDRLR
ncbi:MAG: DUF4293 domain-containing protein [Bacteroidales bacterium]|jgi:hypothetical protein|nr:DUF4293 domain-containing protein [Bacteroidales bacterium]